MKLAALLVVAALLPAGCGCSGDCQSSVQFNFGDVMRGVPLGSVATACVEEATCTAGSPDQESILVYVSNDDAEEQMQTTLTVRNRAGEVVFERRAPLKLKGHKAGRFCSTACRTGTIEYRR